MAYRSSPIKRKRRTKAEVEAIRQAMLELVEQYQPMTVRQIFYQLVSRGVIDKLEREYKGTVVRLLTDMRLSQEMPYGWISDNTRWMRKPRTHDSIEAALEATVRTYRRDLWQEQDDYIEVWLEKEALAGVLWEETAKWDVPLMVTRGYPSLSFLHAAAQCVGYQDKRTYLYYFGDLDPSGLDISRNVAERLQELAPWAEIYFERVAVTREQVSLWTLPTRPTKKSDSRAKSFRGNSVELDAVEPDELRSLAQDCITRHIKPDRWERMRIVEEAERASALVFIQSRTELRRQGND
jgi:hypothetical protein